MAYIQCFIEDAENILDVILAKQAAREFEIYGKYKAARTIQRWFRGYITRKHIAFLHAQATVIQRHWRGHHARHLYFLLLKQKVKEFYEENYNRLATIIQKTWRGYLYRKYVFSYLKLKRWKRNILKKNKFMLQIIRNYEESTWKKMCKKTEREAEEWLAYILFKTHHLLRTYTIKGIYSLNDDKKIYSPIEELLRLIKFTNYMKAKKEGDYIETEETEFDANRDSLSLEMPHVTFQSKASVKKSKNYNRVKNEKSQYEYKFQGIFRKCEEAWLKRYAPNAYSVFASGVYGEEEEEARFNERQAQDALIIQENKMKFGLCKCKTDDIKDTLDYKKYVCKHKTKFTKVLLNPEPEKSISSEHPTDIEIQNVLNIIDIATKFVNEVIEEAIFQKTSLIEKVMKIVNEIIEVAEDICESE